MTDQPHRPYAATVLRWVDGDTVDLELDLGYDIATRQRFRLLGIDTPERGHPGYTEATTFAAHLAPPGSPVDVTTYKDTREKYGRYLATIAAAGVDVTTALLSAGLGVPYNGGTR